MSCRKWPGIVRVRCPLIVPAPNIVPKPQRLGAGGGAKRDGVNLIGSVANLTKG